MSDYGRRDRAGHGVWPVLLAGALAAAVIITTVAAVVALRGGSGNSAVRDARSRSTAVQNSPMSLPTERTAVPDSCGVVRPALTRALVPHADKTNLRSPDTTDRHTECAWARYDQNRSRQLTVELRATQPANGASATVAARQAFQAEWRADSSGKGLAATQRVKYRHVIVDLGDEAYVTYNVDNVQGVGEAVVNVRIVNVLVTVHYVGGDVRGNGKGVALSQQATTKGATAAAKQAVNSLAAQ